MAGKKSNNQDISKHANEYYKLRHAKDLVHK